MTELKHMQQRVSAYAFWRDSPDYAELTENSLSDTQVAIETAFYAGYEAAQPVKNKVPPYYEEVMARFRKGFSVEAGDLVGAEVLTKGALHNIIAYATSKGMFIKKERGGYKLLDQQLFTEPITAETEQPTKLKTFQDILNESNEFTTPWMVVREEEIHGGEVYHRLYVTYTKDGDDDIEEFQSAYYSNPKTCIEHAERFFKRRGVL